MGLQFRPRGLPDIEERRLTALPERGVEVQLRAVKREGRFPVEKWAVDYGAALRLIHRVQVSRRSPWIRGTCPSRDPDVHGGLAWRARHAAIGIRRRTGSVGGKVHLQAVAADRGILVVVCAADFENQLRWAECSVRLQRAGVNVGTSTQAWATRVKVQRGDPGHLILEDEWRGFSGARINSSANVYRLLPATRAEIFAFVLPVSDVDIVQPEWQNAVCVGRLAVTVEVHPVPIDGDERLALGRGCVDLRAESLWRSPVVGFGAAFCNPDVLR